MKPGDVLAALRGGLIVSIQPRASSVLDTPETVVLFARCAAQNGAAGLRIEGVERVKAVRSAVALPIVGLIKRRHSIFAPYITATVEDIDALVAAGADAIAFDATPRPREGGATASDLVRAVRARERVAFADCAQLEDARVATAAGAEIVATTLAGYTQETRGCELPAIELVERMARLHPFAVCEGGIASPQDARAAFAAGASAVTVGTAISDTDALVARFAEAAPRRAP